MSIAQFGKRLLTPLVVAYWRRREPPVVPERTFSPNLSDNVQIAMNLIMPLKDPSAVGRAFMAQALGGVVGEVVAGLNNTGIVHVARFVIVDGNLCMFSIYDGDFSNYIRDFVYNIGNAFDHLLPYIKDGPTLPVEENPEEFIAWIRAHDALQIPDDATVLSPTLPALPRHLALLMDVNPNTLLFTYRAYPGYSAAQVRHALKIGW